MTEKNIIIKQDAFIIADTYGFFPNSYYKFEGVIQPVDFAWGFYADGRNTLKLHVRYDSTILPDEP